MRSTCKKELALFSPCRLIIETQNLHGQPALKTFSFLASTRTLLCASASTRWATMVQTTKHDTQLAYVQIFLISFFLHITYLHRGADILGMHACKPSFCVIQTHKRRIFCPSTSLIAALKCAQKKILKTCFQSYAHQDSF